MGFLYKLGLGLRATLFYIGYGLTAILYGTPSLILPYFVKDKTLYRLIVSWNSIVLLWLRLCCGIRIEAEGLDNIPDKPVVVLSKHQSPWETLYLLPQFHALTVILKRELLKIPFFGWGLKALNPIAIDRSSPKESLKQVLTEGKARVADGYSVLVFPEGTRIDPPKVGNYARSGTGLATQTGTPLIFVAHNAGYFWPARKFLKYPGTIKVKFSPLIDPEGKTSKQLTEEAKQWIETEVAAMGGRE